MAPKPSEQDDSRSTAKASLLSLPTEINLQILSYLGNNDLIALAKSNQYLTEVLKIELSRASTLVSNRDNLPVLIEDCYYRYYGNPYCG